MLRRVATRGRALVLAACLAAWTVPHGAGAGELTSPFLGPDGEIRVLIRPEFRGAVEVLEDLEVFGIEGLEAALTGPWVPAPDASQPPIPSRLLLRGSAEVVARAREVLTFLDVPRPAIVVSMLAAEVRTTGRRERGGHYLFDRDSSRGGPDTLFRGLQGSFEPETFLRAGLTGAYPYQGTSLRFGNAPDDWVQNGAFELVLRMLARERQSDFLAWPTVVLTEGEPGTIESVSEHADRVVVSAGSFVAVRQVPVTTGLVLTVTPVRIGREGAVLDVVADLAFPEPEDPAEIPAAQLRVERRTVATRVTLRDRESMLLGGLKIRRRLDQGQGVPVVRKVPGLDLATGNRTADCEESEILLLLRGRVVVPGPTSGPFLPPGEARRLDAQARSVEGQLGVR